MSTLDLERELQQAWFRAQGLTSPPNDTIHPEDDMYHWDESMGLDLHCRRAEYMRSGCEALDVLRNLLRARGKDLKDVASLLDFACGYGRLTRFLVQELGAERVFVSDVLTSAVDFVRETFGVDGIYSATDPAELAIPRKFSLIWVGSLFSHLPRHRFRTFLETLYGALEPDGMLVFSTHGPHALAPSERDASGYTFQQQSESANLDTAEYGATFVDRRVVEEIANEVGVAHLASMPHELWRIQDLYVASPSALSGLDTWRPAPIFRGGITHAEVDANGHARIGGFVRPPSWLAPVESVEIHVGTLPPIPTTFAPLEGEIPIDQGGARFRQFDWFIEGPTCDIPAGSHTLVAVATSPSGRGAFSSKVLHKP